MVNIDWWWILIWEIDLGSSPQVSSRALRMTIREGVNVDQSTKLVFIIIKFFFTLKMTNKKMRIKKMRFRDGRSLMRRVPPQDCFISQDPNGGNSAWTMSKCNSLELYGPGGSSHSLLMTIARAGERISSSPIIFHSFKPLTRSPATMLVLSEEQNGGDSLWKAFNSSNIFAA